MTVVKRERIDISVVIPAYNEAKRLPSFLDRLASYCRASKKSYEIIVVDDGSTDDTYNAAMAYEHEFTNFQVIRIRKNRGKGYAVRRGLFKSAGSICMFIDADGSTEPEEIGKNLHYLIEDGYDIFIGSRVLREDGQILKFRWHRKLLGTIFNFFIHAFLFKEIKDTQCGFKMFKRPVVRPLFSRSYIRGFGFDLEILFLAFKMGYRIKEGPVSWHHTPGSKINLLTDSIRMFINILQVRNWHCTPINPSAGYIGPDEYRFMYDLENYHWWFVSRRNFILTLIKSSGTASPAILDVGSGTGGNLIEFGKLGAAYGIDISAHAVSFCEKRGLSNVIKCPVEKIQFPDKTFDVITCLDVLEHVTDPVRALRELRRVLKDDGRIIVTVPAFKLLWSRHDDALRHLRRYECPSLLLDLEDAGLKVEKKGYFFFSSFFAVAPIRIMRRFFGPQPGAVRSDTTTLPPKLLNEILKRLFYIEAKVSVSCGLPFGTTLYAVASKDANSAPS